MRELDKIAEAYYEIDSYIGAKLSICRRKRWVRKAQKLIEERSLNDIAYFMMLFAKFESILACRANAIVDKTLNKYTGRIPDLNELIPIDMATGSRKISFKIRAKIVLGKQSAEYSKIVEHYKTRNAIAHTGYTITGIAISNFLQELKGAKSAFKNI